MTVQQLMASSGATRMEVRLFLQVLADRQRKGPHTDKQWEMMYGKTQRTQGQAAG